MLTFIQESFQAYFQEGIEINPLFILMIVGIFIQIIKITIDSIKYKKISIENLFSAGGFPSFHAGIVTGISTIALMIFGINSFMFALSCGIALLFAYDAVTLRFQSGKQAKYINEIRIDLKGVLEKHRQELPLRERIGHTLVEVFGGIVIGFLITFSMCYYFILN